MTNQIEKGRMGLSLGYYPNRRIGLGFCARPLVVDGRWVLEKTLGKLACTETLQVILLGCFFFKNRSTTHY